MSHTPLPFRLVQGEASWEVWSPKDDAPGSMNNFVVADGIQDSEDAAFIVKAVNAHEELVAACKQALKVVSEIADIRTENRAGWAHKALVAAIAKVEGKV